MSNKDISCAHCRQNVGALEHMSETVVECSVRKGSAKIPASPQQLLLQKKFRLVQGESILIEGLSTYIKSTFNCISCHAFLTNYRLVECKKGLVLAAAVAPIVGVAGFAVALAHKPTKITFQVLVSEIASVVKGKYGFAAKYILHTQSGQSYNLQFTKGDKWESAFMSLGVGVTR